MRELNIGRAKAAKHAAAQTGFDAGVVSSDPDIVHGAPVFPGTRVPVRVLQDWLQDGVPLGEFLDSYPTVTPAMVDQVLEFAFERTIGPRDAQNPIR